MHTQVNNNNNKKLDLLEVPSLEVNTPPQQKYVSGTPVRVFGQVEGEIPSWLEGSLLRYDSARSTSSSSSNNNNNSSNVNNNNNYYNSSIVSQESPNNLLLQENNIYRFNISDGKVCLEQHSLPKRTSAKRRQSSTSSIMKDLFGSSEFQVQDDEEKESMISHHRNNKRNISRSLSPVERFMARFEQVILSNSQNNNLCDSCTSNMVYFGEQLYIVTESSSEIQRIEPDSLKLVETLTISDLVPVNSFTAHPLVLEDGSVLNIGNSIYGQNNNSNATTATSCTSSSKPEYYVVHTPPGEKDEECILKESIILATIPSRWKFNQSYYHSFGLTGDKLIFIEQPLRLSVSQTVWSKLRGKPLSTSALKWYSNEKTHIYVISLSTGQVSPITYWTDKLFVFHHINTYEENGCVIMDVIGYDSGQFVADLAKQNLNGSSHHRSGSKTKNGSSHAKSYHPSARRYVLPINLPTTTITSATPSGTNLIGDLYSAQAIYHKAINSDSSASIQCIPEYLHSHTFELPKINSLKHGLKYNYVYGISNSQPLSDDDKEPRKLPNMIVKLNVSTTESISWSEDGKICVSEPIFVSNPTSSIEDDGVLLATLQNFDTPEQTTLLILDAETMAEQARVVFMTNEPMSQSSHGPWVPATIASD